MMAGLVTHRFNEMILNVNDYWNTYAGNFRALHKHAKLIERVKEIVNKAQDPKSSKLPKDIRNLWSKHMEYKEEMKDDMS